MKNKVTRIFQKQSKLHFHTVSFSKMSIRYHFAKEWFINHLKTKHCNTLLLYWDYLLMNQTNKELHGNSPRQVISCNYWRYFSINNFIFTALLLFATIAEVTLHCRKATEAQQSKPSRAQSKAGGPLCGYQALGRCSFTSAMAAALALHA